LTFSSMASSFFSESFGSSVSVFSPTSITCIDSISPFFDQTHCYFALLVSSYSNIRTGENLLKYCAYILHTKSILCEQLMFIFIPDLIFIDSSLVFLHSQFHAFMACLD
jgi:hypothetical protein